MLVTLIRFAMPGLMEREILDYRAWAGDTIVDALCLVLHNVDVFAGGRLRLKYSCLLSSYSCPC